MRHNSEIIAVRSSHPHFCFVSLLIGIAVILLRREESSENECCHSVQL
jgi:hypothetical protein